MACLGIDFGTSNTAAGVMAAGRPVAIELERGETTLPSAVFVDFAERRFVYGSAANQKMIDGQDGRYMRALKSILGTSLAQEPRMFLNERLTPIEIIARFLAEIKSRAEAYTGTSFERALSGRPVRFHSEDAGRDAQAETDLRAAYELAGFRGVDFLPEPEAAALSVDGAGRMLIVDIGGGTSDFTLCERADGATRVLASCGVRIGGTDFDKALNLAHVMPLLGLGARIGDTFGQKFHPAPRALFQDLASWEKIAFVYDPALLREVRRWVRQAEEPLLFERLAEVLEAHLGHDIAHAVEAGKIATNRDHDAHIDLRVIERGLKVPLSPDDLERGLLSFAQSIAQEAQDTVTQAGYAAEDVEQVVFVGGSSLMGAVQAQVKARFPGARYTTSEVFTAVVHGLAIAAA